MAEKKVKFWEPALQWVIVFVAAGYVWFAWFSCRKKIINHDIFKKYHRQGAIFAFWHGRMLMLSPIVALGGMRGYVVASQHSGGRMMAKVQRLFGLRAIYGSSSRGAVSVLRAGVRILRGGRDTLCISPDGPSGPAMRVQDGVMYFAKMSGTPIIPVCFTVSRGWRMKRWDSFLVPKPFSRIVCEMGQPFWVDAKLTPDGFEARRQELEQIMISQVARLDAIFDLPPVEQGIKASAYKQRMRDARAAKRQNKKRGDK